MTKIVVLRGPSGSGKSTVAKAVRDKCRAKTALIGQDHFRRIILKEKDIPDGINSELILDTARFALNKGYNVVLDGIFYTGHYEPMFRQLFQFHPQENYAYYFNVSFEETLRRHSTKDNAHEFGEYEMREWYRENDFLSTIREIVIPEEYSFDASVERILKEAHL